MHSYVLRFVEIDRTRVATVGGKGATLGELSRVAGVRVPAGFCVTTDAFSLVVSGAPEVDEHVERLSRLGSGDQHEIATASAAIREALEAAVVPDAVDEAITAAIDWLGPHTPVAVRSSATAEDLPGASFAGQQDSFLHVVGPAAVLRSVSRCWASLFTERAVIYRMRNGFDHRRVRMAVVVQGMVEPQAAGVLFTADPVTSNRTVTAVEAVLGLGEALVSGTAAVDSYRVRDGVVIEKAITTKERAIVARPGGGTQEQAVEPARREHPALTDEQVVELAALGRRIEAHFGSPQDIEWCLDDQGLQVVQSRPITTLFPVPEVGDGADHVFVSVGHQQMMTDPMKPLGLSMWQLTALRPMYEGGGRLFVDLTQNLVSPAGRAAIMAMLGRSDPLIGDALQTVVDRGDIIPPFPADGPGAPPPSLVPPIDGGPDPIPTDPAIVSDLIRRGEATIADLQRNIATRSGPELFDFIRAELQDHKGYLSDPRSLQAIMAGMQATWWLDEHLLEWLGEKNGADTLTLSVPHNITSEMGLALLDVADVIRSRPEVVAFLRAARDNDFIDRMAELPGGAESQGALRRFLDTYGMRCIGEIDITRPRWSEQPTALLPALLGNIEHFAPGEGTRRFERGREEAAMKERDVLERVAVLPDGEAKAEEVKRMIDRVRTFAGYREHPKYVIVSRLFLYKQALLAEADRLVAIGVLRQRDDIFHLRFDELHEVVRTDRVDAALLVRREHTYHAHLALTPPRVITSDGEVVAGAYRRHDVPAGALVGVPVSAGTVEGRARVIHDMAQADLEPGDILVTTHTDPSWSPVFVAIVALVTEVGGQMSHGAVITREYGLPAVVSVEGATQLIRDGQRIRVDGTEGFVEILP